MDDCSTPIIWTKLFLEAQGYEIKKNILYQDNKSTVVLENNDKKSSRKRTRAINTRYFFITDQVKKGNVMIEYFPTKEMVADYFTTAWEQQGLSWDWDPKQRLLSPTQPSIHRVPRLNKRQQRFNQEHASVKNSTPLAFKPVQNKLAPPSAIEKSTRRRYQQQTIPRLTISFPAELNEIRSYE